MDSKRIQALQIFRFFWQRQRRYPKYIVGIFVCIPITVLVSALLPGVISAHVLTRLSRGDFNPNHLWAEFGLSLILYVGLQLLGVVGSRVIDILDFKLEGRVEQDIARGVYDYMLKQSANFHANHFGGSLVSQTNKLMGAYIRFTDTTVFMTLPMIAGIIWATLILLFVAPLFAVILLIFSVFYITTAILITKKTRILGAKQAAAESKQTGYLADSITNVMAIKSFAGGDFERRQFGDITNQTHNRLMGLMMAMQRQQGYFGVVGSIITVISLAAAVLAVGRFKTNIGTVFLILSYTGFITTQLWTFGTSSLRTYNRAFGDAQEMVDTLAQTPEILDPKKPEKVRITRGRIAFTDMTFAHPDSREDDALFRQLQLSIAPGEKVGLVGHSGSGKTTLTRLLLRFNDLDSGAITIDGQNIAHITQDDLRRHIAYVPQEPLLFHRSIRDNIAYGKPSATDAEIMEAANKAYASEFIDKLPHGYDTLVGERGVKLSGGQRQRIVIARAILKDAPILVLDEATSALDSASEKLIQAALRDLMKNRTAIVIAHRLSTIQKMDRILVLDNGIITEQGTHAELIKHKGTYATLWAHQSGGFIED